MPSRSRRGGVRTRLLLLATVVLIIAATTAASLVVVRHRLRQQVLENVAADLRHSVETFQDLESGRRAALQRENALLADLPSLKALMTTDDQRTIADGAIAFWKTSGNDLFALADADLSVLAADAEGAANNQVIRADLAAALKQGAPDYLLSSGRLYEFSVQPIYFGSRASGTLLGYVISGFVIDQRFLLEVGRGAEVDAAFALGNELVVSALAPARNNALADALRSLALPGGVSNVSLDGNRYLLASSPVTTLGGRSLRLLAMKSFQKADRAEEEINRLVVVAGLLATGAGAILMLLLARVITRPLEQLTVGVRAFGEGDQEHTLPTDGTREIRYLSQVFAEMRDEIRKKNRALVESERLATIGRMASSVSHDLRHYLAAVYANAEFLASPALPASERAELYEEIRIAVNGTADLLDSLLIFSRTGNALQRASTSVFELTDRAVSMVRMHPDAEGVELHLEQATGETMASVDPKQVERALYNLLLNACQSARESAAERRVNVAVDSGKKFISITITDTGKGVADEIRESLFDPFVSRGKQKGTGLGLTLACSVAREHDGDVKLVSSRPGETVFRMTLTRDVSSAAGGSPLAQDTEVAL